MPTITKTIRVDAPLDRVHDVAIDPNSWHLWFAGLAEPDEISGDGREGTVVRTHYQMAGVRLPITTTVKEYRRDDRSSHWHAEFAGGVDGRHTWTYRASDGGTEVSAEVVYEVPGAALGRLMNRLVLERMQERNLEQTLANLKELVEQLGGDAANG